MMAGRPGKIVTRPRRSRKGQGPSIMTPAEIKALADQVGNFDFDAALKSLSGIASRLSINIEGT